MTFDEVLEAASLGEEQGCLEALLTLGDKPEMKYEQARRELRGMGYETTIEYVKDCAKLILEHTSLLPHINAGVVSEDELRELKQVSVSQGLMLESISDKLMQPDMPHHLCPDKVPFERLKVLEHAGKQSVPFTTGLLLGIGDSREDRIAGLLEIRKVHRLFGHVQEIIIQSFIPKKNTKMSGVAEPSLEELLFTIASARILFGPDMNIQAPPNLQYQWSDLIEAGINDWGGISPGLSPDYVNPEKQWPELSKLSRVTAQSGKLLVPRMPIYPEYVKKYEELSKWLTHDTWPVSPFKAVLAHADGDGYPRCSNWFAGSSQEEEDSSNNSRQKIHVKEVIAAVPKLKIRRHGYSVKIETNGQLKGCAAPRARIDAEYLIEKSMGGHFETTEIVNLFSSRGEDFKAVIQAADTVRQKVNGNAVSFVVNRNINYTNICTFGCKFCAFSKGPQSDELRGTPYLLSFEEISKRTREAWNSGATEVCMQGGIHPEFTGSTYLKILEAAKAGVPDMHIHAFSPLEIQHGTLTSGLSLEEYLLQLKEAGLGSLPGTAAEILVDDVRNNLCPDKLVSHEWEDIIRAAHNVGLKTTSTIMFGHIETYSDWAEHLLRIKRLQSDTGGITEFVPLPFVHMEAPIFRKGKSRKGPTLREAILMHAISRLVLNPEITNVQASWVKLGPHMAAQLLKSGCNDMGGTLINESITRAAGGGFGQQVGPEEMRGLIESAGRDPFQRNTLYAKLS